MYGKAAQSLIQFLERDTRTLVSLRFGGPDPQSTGFFFYLIHKAQVSFFGYLCALWLRLDESQRNLSSRDGSGMLGESTESVSPSSKRYTEWMELIVVKASHKAI